MHICVCVYTYIHMVPANQSLRCQLSSWLDHSALGEPYIFLGYPVTLARTGAAKSQSAWTVGSVKVRGVCVCARVPHPCTYTCVCCSACACWRNVGINSIYKLQTTIPAFRVLLGALAPHPQIYLEFLVMNRLKRKSLSSLRFLHK